jgi:hypothetical protein
MMLHAVAGEDLGGPVIPVNGQGYRHCAFGKFNAPPLRFRYLQMVRDQIKLLTGHPESRMIVDLHRQIIRDEGSFATGTGRPFEAASSSRHSCRGSTPELSSSCCSSSSSPQNSPEITIMITITRKIKIRIKIKIKRMRMIDSRLRSPAF